MDSSSYNPLSREERFVIEAKGTEAPFTGEYDNFYEDGVYVCRRCNAELGAVNRLSDPDGQRTEVECANCGGHLGHVFMGEGFTATDARHCVNSLSMKFVAAEPGTPGSSE